MNVFLWWGWKKWSLRIYSSSISNVIGKIISQTRARSSRKNQIFSFIKGKIRSKIFSFFVV